MRSPTRLSLSLVASALLLSGTCATGAAAPAAPPPDPAVLRQQLAAQDRRVALLGDELKAQDIRIEARIDGIVEGLLSISDSTDTRSKVARMKRETVSRLKRNLDYFAQQRANLLEELRRPTWNLTADDRQNAIGKFDSRIEKRVSRMLTIETSLPTEADYARYKVTGSNWAGTPHALNEDYRQNQRLTAQTNAQRKETVAGIDRSIARLESHNVTLQARVALSTAPADEIKALSAEMARNTEMIKTRRSQRAAALLPNATPTRALGPKEAQTLDVALNQAVEELRREFSTLFSRYRTIIAERSTANSTRTSLAALEARK